MSTPRVRSPPYPVSPPDTRPVSRELPRLPRDTSPEISISDRSTPARPHSPPQYPGSLDYSPHPVKELPAVTIQPVQQDLRLSRWQRFRYWANRHWVYEIAACAISTITLVGVIILLSTRQNKPLPEWPALITLNSLIAILTTIMKGCMIFAVAEGISQLKWSWFLQPRSLADLGTYDSASRGPWGSLLFLFSGRLDFIATMGAIITVIALAIDPFAQQVFLFESCTLEHNDAATTIPRVQTFAPVLPGDRTMFVAGDQYARMSNVLQAAYSAMIEPSSHLPARFNHNCPSGNCTWHAPGGYYQTLMFDYACADLSNMISNTTRSASNTTSGPSYMLPSGPSLDSPTNMTIDSDTLIELRTSATLQDPPPFIPFNSTNELFAFTALYWRETVPRKGMIPPEAGPAAATCRVFPVFKTFNATVSNNILTEHEVARQAFPGWLKLPRFLRDGVWEECVSSPVATSNNTMPLSQGQFFLENWQRAALVTPGAPIDKLNITYWNPACTVMMGPVMTQQLGSYFRGLFSQRVPGGPEAIEAGTVSSLYSANASVGNDMHLSAFINGGKADMASIERYMAAMTGAMSAAMRTNANVSLAENQMTRGTTQVVKTCARVRWGWLVLPASLTVATIGFVVAIMVREGLRAKKPGWPGLLKSSPLGLMLYGPVDTSFYEYAGPKDLVTLEARAEEIKTLLERKTQ